MSPRLPGHLSHADRAAQHSDRRTSFVAQLFNEPSCQDLPDLEEDLMRLFFLLTLVAVTSGCAFNNERNESPPLNMSPERSFHLTYEADLSDLKVGEELRLWIPIPTDDPHQRIRNLLWEGDFRGVRHTEPVHRNQMLFFKGKVESPTMRFVVEYDVDRYPYESDLASLAIDGAPDSKKFDVYRQPSRLAFVTDQVQLEADILSAGEAGALGKARAFYDHVRDHMSYDKKHDGWGRGSIEHACDIGMGNCTDFHTYFNSLCLAAGIPARFQIGIYGKYEAVSEEYVTGGYHCWAEFHVPGKAWVPVDISEADKDPNRIDEFFGGHSANRVTLTTGRDLLLSPRQNGPPLNYFLYPYAEQGGQPLPEGQVKKTSRWKDLPTS